MPLNRFLFSILASLLLPLTAAQAKDCTIIYGVYDEYAPFEWMENGNPRGINIDLLEAVSAEAGCAVKTVSLPWPQMLEMLERGQITMISASLTPERMERFIQLPPAFVQYRVFIGRKGSPFIANLTEIGGKVIHVLDSSVAYENLVRANPDVNAVLFPSERAALAALARGEGDLVLIDDISNVAEEYGYTNLTVVSQPLFPTNYGFMLKLGDPNFDRLSSAAERLKETGEYYAIINKARDYKYSSLMRFTAFAVATLAGIAVVIALWNKSLHVSVRRKTEGLKQEIRRRSATEQELLRRKAEYEGLAEVLQTILERVPLLVYIVTQDGAVLWQSNQEESSFSPSLIKEHLSTLAPGFSSEELDVQDADGNLWKILALSLPYEERDAILLFVDDITENIRLRDELFMSSRYSALGEMAAVVAHEINNPIGSILHNFDFLRHNIPEAKDEEQREDIGQATEAVINALTRMKSIVDELRGYTTRRSQAYENVDLRECVKSAVGITRFLINRCTRHFHLDNECKAFVFGNYGQIEQMVINILQNACYALTDKSQAIECSVARGGRDNAFVVLALRDQGSGMDEYVLKKACSPYFTTRKDSGGTGIGLSLVSRLIKEHGGYMKIESEAGRGTTVELHFPAA